MLILYYIVKTKECVFNNAIHEFEHMTCFAIDCRLPPHVWTLLDVMKMNIWLGMDTHWGLCDGPKLTSSEEDECNCQAERENKH